MKISLVLLAIATLAACGRSEKSENRSPLSSVITSELEVSTIDGRCKTAMSGTAEILVFTPERQIHRYLRPKTSWPGYKPTVNECPDSTIYVYPPNSAQNR